MNRLPVSSPPSMISSLPTGVPSWAMIDETSGHWQLVIPAARRYSNIDFADNIVIELVADLSYRIHRLVSARSMWDKGL